MISRFREGLEAVLNHRRKDCKHILEPLKDLAHSGHGDKDEASFIDSRRDYSFLMSILYFSTNIYL